MKAKLLACATAVALVAGVATGNAATIAYNGWSVFGDEPISIMSPTGTGAVWAGEIQLLLNDKVVADAWCVDIYHDLEGSGAYTLGPLTDDSATPTPATLSGAQIAEIGALVFNADSLMLAPPAGYTAHDVAAAVQIAIWEVEYPAFAATGLAAEQTLAAQYVADAVNGYSSRSGPWRPYYDIAALTQPGGPGSAANQSLITIIPEPSAWAMLAIGFAGLGYAAFRKAGRRSVSALA